MNHLPNHQINNSRKLQYVFYILARILIIRRSPRGAHEAFPANFTCAHVFEAVNLEIFFLL